MRPLIDEWYTYQEILDYTNWAPSIPHSKYISVDWFTKVLDEFDLEFAVITLSELIDDEIIEEVVNALMTIVYERHNEDYFFHRQVEHPNVDLTEDEVRKALSSLINVLNLTLPRYIPLLQQNEEFSEAPVSPIHSKSTGKTRFNDTPQDEGLYNNEEHATNVSKSISETEVDSGSIISRLDELFKNWKSIILEWSNEFNRLFFKEEQL